jgi:hypothetical protein
VREILELRDLLLYRRGVLLHSPSGVGTTSLIQVDLIPRPAARWQRVAVPSIRVGTPPPAVLGANGQPLPAG